MYFLFEHFTKNFDFMVTELLKTKAFSGYCWIRCIKLLWISRLGISVIITG